MARKTFVGSQEFFPGVDVIPYEGPDSTNPLSFKVYDSKRQVGDKTMEEHLRFAVCYWHTFCGTGADPFGPGTRIYPWDQPTDPMAAARDRIDAAFEFFSKLGVPYYCFHDVDMAPLTDDIEESEAALRTMVTLAEERQAATGVKLLWGTANLFSHPRYMNGAATNPDFAVVARAGAQVKAAIDATVALGGENYVFWGGREGYACLQNTDTKKETEHFAKFLTMARDYGRSVGFEGTFLIEPKPKEPMFHQYDYDAQTVIGFLRHYDLADDFKTNIEANHATLAGHTFAHDLQMSADAGLLGSIDANRGNPQNGWDTDQFPTDMYDCVHAMMVVLENGGLHSGGLNFDAKLRRESNNLSDMFIAHIGGMDAFARGLLIAHRLLEDKRVEAIRSSRYDSFNVGDGREFEFGHLKLEDLRNFSIANPPAGPQSGQQELVESIVNEVMFDKHWEG